MSYVPSEPMFGFKGQETIKRVKSYPLGVGLAKYWFLRAVKAGCSSVVEDCEAWKENLMRNC